MVKYDTATMPYIDSSAALRDGDFEALRASANVEGYLFFRKLLPDEDILRVRNDLLAIVERHGWRRPGLDPLDGSIDVDALDRVSESAMRTDIGVSLAAYHDVQKLESFHALPHHPALLELYRGLFDRDVLVLAQKIARMITAHHAMTATPPHQDFPHIQGSRNTWTCWFPLGDCPRSMGALTVLHGSHRAGYMPVQPAQGAGGIAVQLCPGEEQWVEGDFEPGDVLTFPCFTVHKALPSRFKQQIRLSMDVRYQPANEPINAKSLEPHCDLTWEEIYTDWQHDELKYYWRRSSPRLAPTDASLLQPGRRIC